MADVHDRETRRRNMSAIRGKNTRPERMVRSWLHRNGIRFRLHDKKLPGSPDLVFAKYRAVLFINGCFWHGHDCPMFRWPATRTEFWKAKINATKARDLENKKALAALGLRTGTVWECALKGRQKRLPDDITNCLTDWLHTSIPVFELRGHGL